MFQQTLKRTNDVAELFCHRLDDENAVSYMKERRSWVRRIIQFQRMSCHLRSFCFYYAFKGMSSYRFYVFRIKKMFRRSDAKGLLIGDAAPDEGTERIDKNDERKESS